MSVPSPVASAELDELVAVCIVTHESAADLPDCLRAVAAQTHRPLEIVVVDCASRDGSAEVARSAAAGGLARRVIALDANLGFAAGMNVAVAATPAPWILTLNADTRPRPDFVASLLALARASLPGLHTGAVTGRLLRFEHDAPAADDVERAAPARPLHLDACGMRLTLTWRHLDRGSGAPDRGQFSHREQVFGGTGAASLWRRAALEDVAVDGEIFAAEFHSFREDAELCLRLNERGWAILYEPAAVCGHRRSNLPSRRAQMSAAVNRHSLQNRYLLRAYHQTAGNLVLTLVPTLARDLLAFGYVLLRERGSLGAYAWLWRQRRAIWRRRRTIQARRTASVNGWFWRDARPLDVARGVEAPLEAGP